MGKKNRRNNSPQRQHTTPSQVEAPETLSPEVTAELEGYEKKVEELGGAKDVQALNTAGMSLDLVMKRAGRAVANLEQYDKEAEAAKLSAEQLRTQADKLLNDAKKEFEQLAQKESEIKGRNKEVSELEAEAKSGFQRLKSEKLSGLEKR